MPAACGGDAGPARSGPGAAGDVRDGDGARASAIACGYEDAIDLERLRQEALKRDEQLREQAAKDKDEYHRSFWKLSENHV